MDQEFIAKGSIPLISILLVLVSVFLNHLLANSRDKIKLRRKQGQALIMAFKQELDALIQSDEDCRLILTEDSYQRHASAIRGFMMYLSWFDKLRLQWLWARLALFKLNKKLHIPFYEQYADCGSLTKRRRIRPLVIKRIQAIFSFANK